MRRFFSIIVCIIALVSIGFAAGSIYDDNDTDLQKALKAHPVGPDGTNPMLIQPNDVYCWTLHAMNIANGNTANDSLIVWNGASKAFRKVSPLGSIGTYSINSATVGLTKAQLNAQYPNVPIGHRVMCVNILLGGAIYIKNSENGSNDVWQTISAPPTP